MNTLTIKSIDDILVTDRLREDYGEQEMEDLIDSIEQYGIIHAVAINQSGQLIAGGRRYAACKALGFTEAVPAQECLVYDDAGNITGYRKGVLPYHIVFTEDRDHLHELELEENLRRKSMTWQEHCKSIKYIHQLKEKKAINDPAIRRWGYRQTAQALGNGYSLAKVGYAIQIATLLENGDEEINNATSLFDAQKILMRRNENAAAAELARRSLPLVTMPKPVPPSTPSLPITAPNEIFQQVMDEQEKRIDVFETEVAKQQLDSLVGSGAEVALGSDVVTVSLSSMLFTQPDMNTLSRFYDLGPGICNHIITDPPFGTDMDMVQQDGGGMNVEEVADTHRPEDNIPMLRDHFLPTAYRALQDNGYCVFWCDIDYWEMLKQTALKIGFKVQRWPIVWDKLHRCQNMAAQYNFTKNIEIAMVCRKGNATLAQPAGRCVITASNDDVKRRYGHAFAKPPAVTEFIARHISIPGQTIGEPFAGRGSIVLPLLEMGRKVLAMEYEKSVHFPFLVNNVKAHFTKLNPNTCFV